MTKQTAATKLANARALVAKYEAQLAAEALANNVEVGDTVTFSFGRGETKKELTGTVTGVRDDSNGRWVAVLSGEGFEANTYRIRTADIIANPTADARVAAAPVDGDPLAAA